MENQESVVKALQVIYAADDIDLPVATADEPSGSRVAKKIAFSNKQDQGSRRKKDKFTHKPFFLRHNSNGGGRYHR